MIGTLDSNCFYSNTGNGGNAFPLRLKSLEALNLAPYKYVCFFEKNFLSYQEALE